MSEFTKCDLTFNKIDGWIGASDFDWMAEKSETVAIRSQLPLDADLASRLHLAFPKLVAADKQHQPDTWIIIGQFPPPACPSHRMTKQTQPRSAHHVCKASFLDDATGAESPS